MSISPELDRNWLALYPSNHALKLGLCCSLGIMNSIRLGVGQYPISDSRKPNNIIGKSTFSNGISENICTVFTKAHNTEKDEKESSIRDPVTVPEAVVPLE